MGHLGAWCNGCLKWTGAQSYMRSSLQRKLFFTTGFAIFAAVGAAAFIFHVTSEKSPWEQELERLEAFFSAQFEQVWDDPAKREELATDAADAFRAGVTLETLEGLKLGRYGSECRGPTWSFPVRRDGVQLGRVKACPGKHAGPGKKQALLGLLGACFVLWIIAGIVAHKMSRPLFALADVTREIGEGKLSARARLGRHYTGEIGTLATSVNEMAERIERQMRGQRELLAGVSHEIRTPLARLRVLTEILRDRGIDEKSLVHIETEITEIDDLTGQLLASSRLEFETLDRTDIDAVGLAETTLTRVGVDLALLRATGEPRPLSGDATLIARALVNLLENAKRHGEGVSELEVRFTDHHVTFLARDQGPGFDAEFLPHAFNSFYRGKNTGKGTSSLGLGLALVERIAHAHDGVAQAQNRPDGGAEVSFSVRSPAAASV